MRLDVTIIYPEHMAFAEFVNNKLFCAMRVPEHTIYFYFPGVPEDDEVMMISGYDESRGESFVIEWITHIAHSISHETIHDLLNRIECVHTSTMFDNIMASVPEDFDYAGF